MENKNEQIKIFNKHTLFYFDEAFNSKDFWKNQLISIAPDRTLDTPSCGEPYLIPLGI